MKPIASDSTFPLSRRLDPRICVQVASFDRDSSFLLPSISVNASIFAIIRALLRMPEVMGMAYGNRIEGAECVTSTHIPSVSRPEKVPLLLTFFHLREGRQYVLRELTRHSLERFAG